jgi:hypothetical protein
MFPTVPESLNQGLCMAEATMPLVRNGSGLDQLCKFPFTT